MVLFQPQSSRCGTPGNSLKASKTPRSKEQYCTHHRKELIKKSTILLNERNDNLRFKHFYQRKGWQFPTRKDFSHRITRVSSWRVKNFLKPSRLSVGRPKYRIQSSKLRLIAKKFTATNRTSFLARYHGYSISSVYFKHKHKDQF